MRGSDERGSDEIGSDEIERCERAMRRTADSGKDERERER